MKARAVSFSVATFLVLLAACSSARRGEPVSGPFRAATPEIARGEQAFMRHCNQCHTGGETSFAPALNNKPAPGFLIKFQVRNGLGAMPAFPESEIGARELDDIVAYMKARRPHPSESTAAATRAR